MEVRLKVRVGANVGQELLVPGPKFFIGRAEDCHLRPRSDLISRHHCVLLVDDSLVAVRDFGSKNGTHVNGDRVEGERELQTGDVLKVGPLEFEVSLGVVAPAKKRPKVESVREAVERTAQQAQNGDAGAVDVSQWLSTADHTAAGSDTRVLMANETSEIDLATDTVSGVGIPGKSVAKKAGEKQKPGKLPPIPQAAGGDSKKAASDVLNKFFKRR